MEIMLQADSPGNVWKYSGFREFLRKYMQIVNFLDRNIELPPILDRYDMKQVPLRSRTLAHQQKAYFESVHANLGLLSEFLRTQVGPIDDEILRLRDFLQSRLRSAVFTSPEKEKSIQDTIEQLLIGRGMQKGQDYDREKGRARISIKEAVPDFVLPPIDLALEVKLIKSTDRAKSVIDEISADIVAYLSRYRHVIFLIYDTGYIRDIDEFRRDFERRLNVSVIVVKH